MFSNSNLFLFGLGGLIAIILVFRIFRWQSSNSSYKPKQGHVNDNVNNNLENIQQQCQRLRQELEGQSKQLKFDFQQETLEQLQTLLTNYPTACKMAEIKPDLPAKNLIALFTPLDNLLTNWGYEVIGKPWEKVEYNPKLHQADDDEINQGELVYIRFVGYRQADKILFPAKVSRKLPDVINSA